MNTLEKSYAYKMYNIALTMSPHYVVKVQAAQRFLQCILLNQLFLIFAESRSNFVLWNVCFCNLLENSSAVF